jgi:DNA polymerase III delta subunit
MKLDYGYPDVSDPHIQKKIYEKIEFYSHKIEPRPEIKNYEEWLRVQYGDYFSENFPMVYTEKYWTLKAKDLEAALIAEFRRHNRKATAGAITALQASIGSGLGELLAAVSQLCADTEADVIDEVEVSQYYAGVVGVMGWDLSDAMWNAQPVELLEKFRWAMANDSSAAVPAVSAISSGLRSLIKYASAPANMSENELAPLVGVPPWKLRFLRAQKAKWHPDQLAAAARLLALADRSSKGTVYDVAIPGGRSLESSQTLYHMEKEFMAIRAPKD